MFIIFARIDSDILEEIPLSTLKEYKINILLSLDEFKEKIIRISEVLKLNSENKLERNRVFIDILENYIGKINKEQLELFLSKNYNSFSKQPGEITPRKKQIYGMTRNYCRILRFLIKFIEQNEQYNDSISLFLLDLIRNPNYGIISRISEFFQQHYRVCLFLHLIEIITLELKSNKNLTLEEKSSYLSIFLKIYMNINGIFSYEFLGYQDFIGYMDIKEKKVTSRGIKSKLEKTIGNFLFEILIGVASEKTNVKSIFYEIFTENSQSNLDFLKITIMQIAKICYPEYEILNMQKDFLRIMEKNSLQSDYINSNLFSQDFFLLFLKNIACSSITSYYLLPEIVGKIGFHLPFLNTIENLKNSDNTLGNAENTADNAVDNTINNVIDNMIKNKDMNPFVFFYPVNKFRFLKLIEFIVKTRMENTFFYVFRMYKKFLTTTLDQILILLNFFT